jgi:TetR/AcrR family acrAB operon transcriptional repressor
MPRKTRAESAATSERILNAAEKLFVQKGADKISLQHVANAANVTRSAVCWHFSNKVKLYNAVVERLTTPSEQELQMLDELDSGNPLADLRTYIFGILKRVVSDPRAAEILKVGYVSDICVSETTLEAERYYMNVNNWTGQIKRRVALAKAKGILSERADPNAISTAVWLMIDGMVRTWMFNRSSFDLLRQGEGLIDPYLEGLKSAFSANVFACATKIPLTKPFNGKRPAVPPVNS